MHAPHGVICFIEGAVLWIVSRDTLLGCAKAQPLLWVTNCVPFVVVVQQRLWNGIGNSILNSKDKGTPPFLSLNTTPTALDWALIAHVHIEFLESETQR